MMNDLIRRQEAIKAIYSCHAYGENLRYFCERMGHLDAFSEAILDAVGAVEDLPSAQGINEERIENLSFSFRALAKSAEKLLAENEALKAFLRDACGNCETCKFSDCFTEQPCASCKYCRREGQLDNWEFFDAP